MTLWIMAMTYPPKIEGVKSGAIRQTIREWNRTGADPPREKKVGDRLLLHTWAGIPYHSAWNWRLETAIRDVMKIRNNMEVKGGQWEVWAPNANAYIALDDSYMNYLAREDGIVPPNKKGLEDVLMKLNNNCCIIGSIWDVIRW